MLEGPSDGVADTLLTPRLLLPVAPENTVLEGCGVAIRDGSIMEVGPNEALAARHPNARRIDLGSHVLLPGLVNAHGHLAMTLLRGLGESAPLEAWLENTIWPLEGKWVDADFVRDGVRLAVAEMLASGTTTASDMYYFPEVAAMACQAAGFRLQASFPIIEVPNVYAKDVGECFTKGLELHDRFRDDALISTCFGPHSAYTVSADSLGRVAMLADEIDVGVQTHLHETAAEVATANRQVGRTWIRVLDEVGLLNENLQAVHMTAVTQAEVDLVAERGVRVIHCPHSNMKLASGACPASRFAAAGAAVGLGTDGAASNNGLDLFAEARLAALLAKHEAADATSLPASDVLSMATLGGARALGLDEKVGSIEAGKRADLIAVDLAHPAMQPLHDVRAHLVHCNAGAHVTHTFVDGELLYENGAYHTLDIDDVLGRAAFWGDRLRA